MQEQQSRFSALVDASVASTRELDLSDRESGMPRLWRGFMAARILVAGVLLILLLYLRASGQPPERLALLVCIAYLVLTVWVRVLGRPTLPGARLDPQWLITVGADVVVFGLLLHLQVGSINFTALFVLPVLLAAVLGPLLLALGTAAAVTVALLFDALQYTIAGVPDTGGRYLQAAITGTGLFVVAYLANQLSSRLVRQERVALGSEMAARAQIQVNQLVIDSLGDGVLVIDVNGVVHAANPAAREILGANNETVKSIAKPPFVLEGRQAWHGLADLSQQSLREQRSLTRDMSVEGEQGNARQLHVKTLLSVPAGASAKGILCVMFMEDLREIEARVRTEKLAAMGRMSAAVAHEIRNPLSAISQANELLAEEVQSFQQKNLVSMVAQNVQRLNRVVEDVLDVARVQSGVRDKAQLRDPARFISSICDDWIAQNKAENKVVTRVNSERIMIEFEADHLRRVLVNLLDNALRHASGQMGSIQVTFQPRAAQDLWQLSIWSDGAPIDSGVQRHLFEPFFSSQSRSSGLGLYICRELCMRHGATIVYHRSQRASLDTNDKVSREGNDFLVLVRPIVADKLPEPLTASRL
jgi:two-component system, NtrC family, sensor histidine kinase PilS